MVVVMLGGICGQQRLTLFRSRARSQNRSERRQSSCETRSSEENALRRNGQDDGIQAQLLLGAYSQDQKSGQCTFAQPASLGEKGCTEGLDKAACRKDAWFATKHRRMLVIVKDGDAGESFLAEY
jgi:hypothetical protein